MNGQEQTLSISILSPETLRLAKENSEILKQYLKDQGTASLKLGGAEGQEITLPDSILRLVYEALSSAATGKRLRLVEEDEEVSPEKAAEFLQVSRPHLVKLLDGGEIPFHYVGTHRRITMSDLIDEDFLAQLERQSLKKFVAELRRVAAEI